MNDDRVLSLRAWFAAVGTIVATYVYFLLFAEFALLGLAEKFAAAGWSLRGVMGVLGVGGVVGSVVAARVFRLTRFKWALAGGFLVVACAAALTLLARRGEVFIFAVGWVGLGLGWLTVTLAAGLRAAVAEAHLGLACGLGTGAAYALCNLPGVFDATPTVQTEWAVGVTLAGAMLVPWLRLPTMEPTLVRSEGRGKTVGWVAALLTLVWLDSAVFYIIQHTPAFKASTWAGAANLGANAMTHLGAAVVAGYLLDRGYNRQVVLVAGALLISACLGLQRGGSMVSVPVLYTMGVSLYSTVLVCYPARRAKPGIAALVYAVAGWIGSALGIGMAQDLQRVPGWFLLFAGGMMLLVMSGRRRQGVVGLMLFGVIDPQVKAEDSQVILGRAVYVSEGCIHCHSQYVRPQVKSDVERWGPAQELAATLAAAPPLVGNRRQGPDLAEVGNRRSPEWQRLHLRQPRSIHPGSRMPDYDYLFRGDGERGEALVAYLASLGRETTLDRLVQIAGWRPVEGERVIDSERGARWFAQACVACHGATGRGDGPLTAALSVRPPDWTSEPWRRIAKNETEVETTLARIIKFGLPGTPMAGHEYLSDGDTVALARYVRNLHKDPSLLP